MTLHQLGPFTLDTRTHLLMREDEIVKAPMKTIQVLAALVDRRGAIVTKDELMTAVWPDSIVEEANLSVHVALLRKTLGDAAPIETVSKRGYRLLAATSANPPISANDQEAHGAVLRGRYFWNKFTRDALARASASFAEALRLNPRSGEAHSGLCDALLMQGLFGFDHRRDVFSRATAHGEQAALLASNSADAHASDAFSRLFDQYDFKAAGRALERARSLAPTRLEPHLWSALFFALNGETLRALAAVRDAAAIDPISLKGVVGGGFHLYLSQQFEPDVRSLEQILELEPEFAVAHWALGLACDRLGDFQRAESAHRAAVLFSGASPTMESNLARSFVLAGKREEGTRLLERLRGEGLASYRRATIETALGENEAAIASLERALVERDPWLVVLSVDPMLEAIRNDRRVRRIEKEVGRG